MPRTRRLQSLLHCCHSKPAALCRRTSREMQPLLSLIELLGTLWHKRINYSFVLPDAHYLCIRGNRVASVSKELIRIDDCLLGCNTQAALSRLLTADGELKLRLLWDWHKFCVNKVFINSKNPVRIQEHLWNEHIPYGKKRSCVAHQHCPAELSPSTAPQQPPGPEADTSFAC